MREETNAQKAANRKKQEYQDLRNHVGEKVKVLMVTVGRLGELGHGPYACEVQHVSDDGRSVFVAWSPNCSPHGHDWCGWLDLSSTKMEWRVQEVLRGREGEEITVTLTNFDGAKT